MKLIFSRKGFDSATGGCPSPIIDGRPFSVPIDSSRKTPVQYRDLPNKLGQILCDLTGDASWLDEYCHLDPDIDNFALPRLTGFRGALGQIGAAQGHLQKQGIGAGDLFLFFGLFRRATFKHRWKFEGPREHRLFGWLQIDHVQRVGPNADETLRQFAWLKDHPHTHGSDWHPSNTLYVARRDLEVPGLRAALPGWGLFPSGMRLTAPDAQGPSVWKIPAWLNPKTGGVGMTYHPAKRFESDGTLRSAGRGQEFVADVGDRADAMRWVRQLFQECP